MDRWADGRMDKWMGVSSHHVLFPDRSRAQEGRISYGDMEILRMLFPSPNSNLTHVLLALSRRLCRFEV